MSQLRTTLFVTCGTRSSHHAIIIIIIKSTDYRLNRSITGINKGITYDNKDIYCLIVSYRTTVQFICALT